MQILQKIRRRATVGWMIVLVAGAMLTATGVTGAAAAGRGSGHVRGGASAPLLEQAPSPAPNFNPSTPYTVPQSPEVPVPPGGPGSIFGNGSVYGR